MNFSSFVKLWICVATSFLFLCNILHYELNLFLCFISNLSLYHLLRAHGMSRTFLCNFVRAKASFQWINVHKHPTTLYLMREINIWRELELNPDSQAPQATTLTTGPWLLFSWLVLPAIIFTLDFLLTVEWLHFKLFLLLSRQHVLFCKKVAQLQTKCWSRKVGKATEWKKIQSMARRAELESTTGWPKFYFKWFNVLLVF